MANTADLQIYIRAKDEASKVLDQIDRQAGGLGKTLGTALKIGALGAAAGIGAAGVALLSFAKSAAEEQVGIARLQAAIGNLDAAHRGSAGAVEALISQREKLAYSDDALRDSLSMLVAQTGDYEEAIRRQAIAMDFARGTGIDLGTASKLLGKVTDETTSVLGRYGIVVREGADAQEVLTLVQQKFAGQAVAYSKTAAGAWERFNIKLDDIKETMGSALLPILTRVGTGLADFLTKHEADIERMVQDVSDLVEKGFAKVSGWFEDNQAMIISVLQSMKAGVETVGTAIKDVGNWLLDNKALLIAAIVGIGVAFAWANPLAAALIGVGGVVMALGLFQVSIEALPPPLLNLRAEIDKVAITTIRAAEALISFAEVNANLSSLGMAEIIKRNFWDPLEGTKNKLAELKEAAQRDYGAIQAQVDALHFDNAVNQLGKIEREFNNAAAAGRNFQAVLASLMAAGIPWSAVMSYQVGGIIPGPVGMPQLAVVHGGERVVPVGGAGGALAGATYQGGATTIIHSHNYGQVTLNIDNTDALKKAMREQARLLRGL